MVCSILLCQESVFSKILIKKSVLASEAGDHRQAYLFCCKMVPWARLQHYRDTLMEILNSLCIIFFKYSANFDFRNNQIRVILTQNGSLEALFGFQNPLMTHLHDLFHGNCALSYFRGVFELRKLDFWGLKANLISKRPILEDFLLKSTI